MNTATSPAKKPTPAAPAMTSRADTVNDVVRRACARIAPTWPLDRFIAVNPFWQLTDQPIETVAERLSALSGAQLLMSRQWYREAYTKEVFTDEHLRQALALRHSPLTLEQVARLLHTESPQLSPRQQMVDVVDAQRDLTHQPAWRHFVVHSISQYCAAFFDEGQASFGPSRDGGLFASWRRQALTDRSPSMLMAASQYRAVVTQVPPSAEAATTWALEHLGVAEGERETYLWSLLLDVQGWASWCAYRQWVAGLEGRRDETLHELLAIRLTWEALLLQLGDATTSTRWRACQSAWAQVDRAAQTARADDWVFQVALELAWREPVMKALPAGFAEPRPEAPQVQAVFCIDVRSEVFRRALEGISTQVQTLGFAGFFGLPIGYQAAGTNPVRPQLPGLLGPRLLASDTALSSADLHHRHARVENTAGWRAFKNDALSTFSFVDAMGLTSVVDLVRSSLSATTPGTATLETRTPQLVSTVTQEPISLEARCDLAQAMLRGMSLTRGLAPIVLLVGHGSSTTNNPHAAGLDCGACCGQTGEVNARVAAALLNDPQVRAGLTARGLEVPPQTRFIAALHDTTRDTVQLFDGDLSGADAKPDLTPVTTWLTAAGTRARVERAPALGLTSNDPDAVTAAVDQRSRDWAQVRPEWGLANNAAFIVAPREHCRHLDLKGRSFLHEYRHREDPGYAVLETIMTAPMVVTHWINLQYYASTVDNRRYGSGNKVLHNVVGGHLGVFEGNGGDLRIGLPLQSLHDGSRWVHTPLRLTVFIEAPREAISAIVQKHSKVRELVENGWLFIVQLDETARTVCELQGGQWHLATAPNAS